MGYALLRPRGSRTWHYRFQVNGSRVQRSTRETVKTRAEEVADRAYRDAVCRANGGEPVPTLGQLAISWLHIHSKTASAAHLRSVDTFARLHMYDLGEKPVDEISTEQVELARNQHLETHSPASTNHWMRVLKLLCMWAVKREIIPKLSWKVAMLKVQKKPRATLAINIARAWFEALDKECVRRPAVAVAVRLMFGLGLRESEASTARWEWFDWQRKTYTPGITKGREADPIPMPAWLVDYLMPKRQEAGLVVTRSNGGELPPGYSREPMRRTNAACSISGITPHRLRGTFATLLSEAGVPIQTIQKVMRHKHPMTTMAYLEKNFDLASRAQNQIGGKVGFEWRESGARLQSSPTAD